MEISTNKRIQALLSIFFLMMGSSFFYYGVKGLCESEYEILVSSLFIGAGFICIVFFYQPTRLLMSNAPGLIVNDEGITDNSLFPNDDTIKWGAVASIEYPDIPNPSYVYVFLNDPGEYIRNRVGIERIFYLLRNYFYKTPIIIFSINLKCSSKELFKIMAECSLKYVGKNV